MFESIKLKIIEGRKLKPFATARVIQNHEDRIKALEEANGVSEDTEENSNPTPVVDPVTYDLSFTVNDGTDPVKGATVTIGDKTGTTGDAGGCTIKGIAEGTVTVEVVKEGFVTKSESIVVSENNVSFTISLTAE